MNGTFHDLILIFVIAAVTILLRALPFCSFRRDVGFPNWSLD